MYKAEDDFSFRDWFWLDMRICWSFACIFRFRLYARMSGRPGRRCRKRLCHFVLQGYADAIERDAVNEIRGSVQGVYNPVVSRAFFLFRPFFGNEPRFGQDFPEAVHQHLLGGLVHVGHVVMAAFSFHVLAADFFCLLADKSGYGFAQGEYLLGRFFQIQRGLVGHSANFFKKLDLFVRGLVFTELPFCGLSMACRIRPSACVRYAGLHLFRIRFARGIPAPNGCKSRLFPYIGFV